MDSAAALTGCVVDIPRGCMVALSSVGSEGHAELGELVRSARAVTLDRLKARLNQAVAEGEIPASADVHALARFVQTVQNGMSILARDGASRANWRPWPSSRCWAGTLEPGLLSAGKADRVSNIVTRTLMCFGQSVAEAW